MIRKHNFRGEKCLLLSCWQPYLECIGSCQKEGCQIWTYTDNASFVRFSYIQVQSNMNNLVSGTVYKNA